MTDTTSTASTPSAGEGSSGSSSTLKEKLHHIGEKLALVPPTDKELSDRIEVARANGDEEAERKLLMKRAAAGQEAATDANE